MPSSYSVSAIGADPMFQAYMAAQQQNYLTQQADATRVAQSQAYQQAVTSNPTDMATQYLTSQSQTVSPRYAKEETHTFRNLSIAVGAAALLYACYKGKNGNPIDGIKTIGKELKGAWNKVFNSEKVAEGSKKVQAILGKDVQEYTVMKDGMEFLMKDGKPVKIITADKQVITDAAKVTEWVNNNTAAKDIIKNLNVSSGVLPKGVSLSYTKEIADGANTYRLVVENGKVVKAFGKKDKAGKFIEVAEKDLSAFIKNHSAQVKEAETLTKTTTLNKVRLLNEKGALYDAGTQNVTWSVRNGQVVSANIGGRTLKPEEIQALQKDFGAEIKLFGKESAGTYKDIKGFEYIYRTSKADTGVTADQRIRFGTNVPGHTSNWITEISSINKKELTTADDIKKFLENNSAIQTGLNEVSSNGTFTNGFRLGKYTIKSDSGNIYTVLGNNRIQQIQLADGTIISGNKAIKNWKKIANEFARYFPEVTGS